MTRAAIVLPERFAVSGDEWAGKVSILVSSVKSGGLYPLSYRPVVLFGSRVPRSGHALVQGEILQCCEPTDKSPEAAEVRANGANSEACRNLCWSAPRPPA